MPGKLWPVPCRSLTTLGSRLPNGGNACAFVRLDDIVAKHKARASARQAFEMADHKRDSRKPSLLRTAQLCEIIIISSTTGSCSWPAHTAKP
jgi:hypothetical protein